MSRRLEFEERAAVLEFDGGFTRTEAEKRALADICDELAGCGRVDGILGELIRAAARRYAPVLEEAVQALGLAGVRAPLWGFGCVVAEQGTWRPADEGEAGMAAVIVPACEDGAVVDLVAQGLARGRMLCRLGLACLLGADEVERARDSDNPLPVFGDAVAWLRGHGRGTAIVDWHRAPARLDGVRVLLCRETLAPALHRATRRCRPLPTIAVPRLAEARHAA